MSQTPPLRRGFRSRTLATIRLPLLAAALAVLLAAGGLATNGSISGDPGGRGSPPGATGDPPPPSAALPTPIRHVFVIYLENEGVDQIYGKVPFETHLANEYAWGGDALTHHMTGYYAICHPSAPNYLAVTSGNSLQCGSDAYHNYTTERNLFNLLDTAGRTWRVYAESMPRACDLQSSGEYAVRHNPVPFFGDLGGDGSRSICRTHDLPLANLTEDYPYGSTPPNFTFVVPNLLNDGHDTSAAVADWFLSQFVSKLVNQTWFSTSAIFVTYDESFGTHPDSGYDGLDGGPVYLASVSPYSKGIGAVDATNASHYNLMSTIEWLLGLPGTGTGNDSTPAFPAMKGLFKFPNTTAYALSGMVIASGPKGPIAGATVVVGGGPRTITGANGAFAVELANGSYPFAVAPVLHFVPRPASGTLTVTGVPQIMLVEFSPGAEGSPSGSGNVSSGSFTMTFSTVGLPAATPWTLTLDGVAYPLQAAQVTANLSLATHTFSVAATGYGATPASGTIGPQGSSHLQVISFSPVSPPDAPSTSPDLSGDVTTLLASPILWAALVIAGASVCWLRASSHRSRRHHPR
jgi:hypothetical protein